MSLILGLLGIRFCETWPNPHQYVQVTQAGLQFIIRICNLHAVPCITLVPPPLYCLLTVTVIVIVAVVVAFFIPITTTPHHHHQGCPCDDIMASTMVLLHRCDHHALHTPLSMTKSRTVMLTTVPDYVVLTPQMQHTQGYQVSPGCFCKAPLLSAALRFT